MRTLYVERSIPRALATLALKRFWPGVLFSRISPLHDRHIPEPELPGRRWVRVANRACGICASDLLLVKLDVDPMTQPAALPPYQRYYLGHEVVSQVTQLGADVHDLALGDRVAMTSRFLGPTCRSQEIEPLCRSCAEGNYTLCENALAGVGPRGVGGGWSTGYTCHESEIWRVPDVLDDDQGVLVEPLACGVRAALKRLPELGERALVIGCGTIGLAMIQAVRAFRPGAELYAAARYPQQIAAAERFGARALPQGDLLEAAAEVTGGTVRAGDFKSNRALVGGFDVIYDCVGKASTVGQSLRLARARGTVVVVGVSARRFDKLDLTPTWHQEVTVVGVMAHGSEVVDGQRMSTFDLTGRLLAEKKLTADGLITHRFPLSDWRRAIETASDKQSGAIKVVLEPDA